MIRKSLGLNDFQSYQDEVRKGLEKKDALPKYPIRMDHVVHGTQQSGLSIAPSMATFEEVPGFSKKVDFKAGEGETEFVLKYKTSSVKYEDPENPGKFINMEAPVLDMADINGFVDVLIKVSELYQMMREFGLAVLATHDAFNGPISIRNTGPQLAEKLTGIDGNAAYTVTQLSNAGKSQAEIIEAIKVLDSEKMVAVIRNAVHVNSVKGFIAALKDIKEQLTKQPAQQAVINVDDSPAEAVIHKVPAVQAEPIKVGNDVKPTKTDILS